MLSGDEGIKFSDCEEYVTTLAVNGHDRKKSYIEVKAIILHLGEGWWQKQSYSQPTNFLSILSLKGFQLNNMKLNSVTAKDT